MWGCALGLKFNLASGTLHAEEGGVGGGHKALDAAGDLELVVSCLQVPSLSFGRNMVGSTAGCCGRSVHAPHISPVCLLHSALLQKQQFLRRPKLPTHFGLIFGVFGALKQTQIRGGRQGSTHMCRPDTTNFHFLPLSIDQSATLAASLYL